MTGDPEDPDSPHPFPFRTSWHTLCAAGEPSSVIRISNLSTTISGPADAWGREDRPQPFSISVEVSLGEPFIDSSRGDVLKNDTVHYGLLSKHVMKTVEKTKYDTLDALVSYVRGALLGPPVGDPGVGDPAEGFLDGKGVRYLKIRARLPKASKLGTGVSIVDSLALQGGREAVSWSRTLAFHDLRVPVLIGVNDNERQAKQIVVANIEIDKWAPQMVDAYPSLEDIITNTMGGSSFETLEALAHKIGKDMDDWLVTRFSSGVIGGFRFKICLEKPIAVPLADAPCVEFQVNSWDLRPKVKQ